MEPYQNNSMSNNSQLQRSLEGVKKAVQGEREDELFYEYLIRVAPASEEKEIIGSIRDDERRHNALFKRIYEDFTGVEVPSGEKETFEIPESYLDGIKKALFGELRAVERYRAIRRGLPMGAYRDILFDIITDELKHASKYNYLFTLNSTMNVPSANETPTNVPSTNETAMNESTMTQETSKFTPDEWVKYITPLVNQALGETKEGINSEHLYQEYILSGVLVGLGKNPQEAIEEVENWEKTGTSKLLASSKMNRYYNY